MALATAGLGLWQLDRAARKQAWFDAVQRQQSLAPWGNAQLAARVPAAGRPLDAGQAQQLLHRPVQLQGQWVEGESVFLDNRQMQGKAGFFVLTPLRLAEPHGQTVVVVQRGWVPRNFLDRQALPAVQTPAGLVSVQGRLEAAPSRLLEFESGADPDGKKSDIRQNVDILAWARDSALPLLALSVVQTDQASEGLLRDWPVVNAGVEKHYGYAFQWFGLSVLVVLLYVWFQLVRRYVLPRGGRA